MQCNARCSCQKRQGGRQQTQSGTSHFWFFGCLQGAQLVGPIVTGSSWRDAASLFFSIAFAFSCRPLPCFLPVTAVMMPPRLSTRNVCVCNSVRVRKCPWHLPVSLSGTLSRIPLFPFPASYVVATFCLNQRLHRAHGEYM